MYTDTELLDWLEQNTQGYGLGWICRDSTRGRGLRVHETSDKRAKKTVREAIADAIEGCPKQGLITVIEEDD